MVKTNSKKSLIAMIAMVVLLIASIAMGITGAWFTDKATQEKDATLDFGKVNINLTESTAGAWSKLGNSEKVMPGSSYSVTYTLANTGDQDVYYQITATAVLQDSTGNPVTEENIDDYITITVNTDSIGSKVDGKDYYELAVSASKTVSFSVAIAETTPNTVGDTVLNGGDYNVAIKVEVQAVQAANFTADNFDGISSFEIVADTVGD